jgi:hypothetical protein
MSKKHADPVSYGDAIWRFLDSMGFDLTEQRIPQNTKLESTVIQAFESQGLNSIGDNWKPLASTVRLASEFADMTLLNLPFEIKTVVAIYTAILVYLDTGCDLSPDVFVPELKMVVSSMGKNFQDPVVGYLFHLIATEIPKYYGPISSSCILKSTLDYCIGSIIECEYPNGVSVPPSSSRFPRYLRRKTGASESFVHFMFPDVVFPEKQYMGTYLPAIPDIIEIVDRTNDIMSFYKECVVGTEENNFIVTSAKLQGCDPVSMLDEVCQDLVRLSTDVKATLDLIPGGHLKEAFFIYIKGFIMWHITGKRYRLDEIGFQMGSSPQSRWNTRKPVVRSYSFRYFHGRSVFVVGSATVAAVAAGLASLFSFTR